MKTGTNTKRTIWRRRDILLLTLGWILGFVPLSVFLVLPVFVPSIMVVAHSDIIFWGSISLAITGFILMGIADGRAKQFTETKN